MAKSEEWRPRLSIDITEEQYFALQRLFPWGVKQEFMRSVVDDIISLLERKGELGIAAVLSHAIRFKELSKTLQELEDLPNVHTKGPSTEIPLGNDDGGASRAPSTTPPLSTDAESLDKETTSQKG